MKKIIKNAKVFLRSLKVDLFLVKYLVIGAALSFLSLTIIRTASAACALGVCIDATPTYIPEQHYYGPPPAYFYYLRQQQIENNRRQAQIRQEQRNRLYNEYLREENIYVKNKNYEAALEVALQREQLRDGKYVRAFINWLRGKIAFKAGHYHEALQYFERTLYAWPNNTESVQKLKNWVEQRDKDARDRVATAKAANAYMPILQNYFANQAKNMADKEAAIAQKAANYRLQVFSSNLSIGLPEISARTNPSGTGSTNAFGIASNPSNINLIKPDAVFSGGTGAMNDALKMNGSSNIAVNATTTTTTEQASASAGTTPDTGGGNPSNINVVTPVTPQSLPVSVLNNPQYQDLVAKKENDQAALSALQGKLNSLKTQQSVAASGLDKQNIQIQIYNMSGDLEAAKTQIAIDDNNINDTIKTILAAPIVVNSPSEIGSKVQELNKTNTKK